MSSEPSSQCVAPFGGTRPVYTTDPIAVGWPIDNGPVLLDISSSITTRGLARRRCRLGDKLPGKWVMDHRGDPTDDPHVVFGNPPGTLLPVGGVGAALVAVFFIIRSMTQRGPAPATPRLVQDDGLAPYLQLVDRHLDITRGGATPIWSGMKPQGTSNPPGPSVESPGTDPAVPDEGR